MLLGGVALLADSHTIQLLGTHLSALSSPGRSVVLSIDDGPDPGSTPQILTVLRTRGVPASFFLIGERVERYPELAARIVREGHQVGNHSYSHPRMVLEHPRLYAREIDRTDRLIRRLGYRGRIDFRPPYGQKLVVLPWLLARRGTLSVLWNVDSRDWSDSDPASIARRVVSQVRPGSIVLLHDLPHTARALPLIIDALRLRGYRFRTVRPVAVPETTMPAITLPEKTLPEKRVQEKTVPAISGRPVPVRPAHDQNSVLRPGAEKPLGAEPITERPPGDQRRPGAPEPGPRQL